MQRNVRNSAPQEQEEAPAPRQVPARGVNETTVKACLNAINEDRAARLDMDKLRDKQLALLQQQVAWLIEETKRLRAAAQPPAK